MEGLKQGRKVVCGGWVGTLCFGLFWIGNRAVDVGLR